MENSLKEDRLLDAISRLDMWVEGNGWAGYDPYDIKGCPAFISSIQSTQNSFVDRLKSRIIFGLDMFFPRFARLLFQVKPAVNSKAMGLFARAYLKLFHLTGSERYQNKAMYCLNWLTENSASGYKGISWGYPFDWQSRIFIPKNTPSSVVTSIVGDAFWEAWKLSHDDEFLKKCCSICEFFLSHLNVSYLSPNALCFSYTPLDNFHVHNANLFVAEFLIRVGKEIGNLDWVNTGCKAANYTVSEQNPDGSINYWGVCQSTQSEKSIDHYHSGFEIRSLYNIWKLTDQEEFHSAYKKYYDFYSNNLILRNSLWIAPKMTPDNFYPVNIHSCAEALLLNSLLAKDEPRAREDLKKLFVWIISNMQTKDGWFLFMIRNLLGFQYKVKIPFIRWGQAWMLLALAQTLEVEIDRVRR